MQTFFLALLMIGLAGNAILLVRMMKVLEELKAKPSNDRQIEVEAIIEPYQEPFHDNVPPPWVTRAIKQSNDWTDPQDRGDELAALREKMKLSRHMT